MIPDSTAIVPALGCVACGRLIPLPGAHAKHKQRHDQAQLGRVMRAARRQKIARGG